MWLSNGKIIIEPNLTTEPLTLDELLAGVTDENRHILSAGNKLSGKSFAPRNFCLKNFF